MRVEKIAEETMRVMIELTDDMSVKVKDGFDIDIICGILVERYDLCVVVDGNNIKWR